MRLYCFDSSNIVLRMLAMMGDHSGLLWWTTKINHIGSHTTDTEVFQIVLHTRDVTDTWADNTAVCLASIDDWLQVIFWMDSLHRESERSESPAESRLAGPQSLMRNETRRCLTIDAIQKLNIAITRPLQDQNRTIFQGNRCAPRECDQTICGKPTSVAI